MIKTIKSLCCLLIFGFFLTQCHQVENKQQPQTDKADTTYITCIVGRNINYYFGFLTDSGQLKTIDLSKKGLIGLVNAQLDSGKKNVCVVVKPSYEPGFLQNFENVIEWLDENGKCYRKNAKLNRTEQKWLGLSNPHDPDDGKPEPLRLFFPKEPDGQQRVDSKKLKEALSVVLLEDEGLFVYRNDIRSGNLVNYKEFRKIILEQNKKTEKLYVVIKPSKSATYKNTVNMLDEMTKNNIKQYALIDLTDEEEEFIINLKSEIKSRKM